MAHSFLLDNMPLLLWVAHLFAIAAAVGKVLYSLRYIAKAPWPCR